MKIYNVRWVNKKLTSPDINVACVMVRGDKLTPHQAQKLAKKQIEFDCGKNVFRKNKLVYFGTVDISNFEPVLSVSYH